jgi:hypothetical protein
VYSSLTKKIDSSQVYAGGWYFLGPFSSFMTFPATLVNIDYSNFKGSKYPPIACRDGDQQQIELSMSVQYKLQYANIGRLQDQFQQGYEAKYANYIEQVVRETVGNFTGTAFWTNRKESGDLLR